MVRRWLAALAAAQDDAWLAATADQEGTNTNAG
jgi:hypothetical protein